MKSIPVGLFFFWLFFLFGYFYQVKHHFLGNEFSFGSSLQGFDIGYIDPLYFYYCKRREVNKKNRKTSN
jgi:hypothetical protein